MPTALEKLCVSHALGTATRPASAQGVESSARQNGSRRVCVGASSSYGKPQFSNSSSSSSADAGLPSHSLSGPTPATPSSAPRHRPASGAGALPGRQHLQRFHTPGTSATVIASLQQHKQQKPQKHQAPEIAALLAQELARQPEALRSSRRAQQLLSTLANKQLSRNKRPSRASRPASAAGAAAAAAAAKQQRQRPATAAAAAAVAAADRPVTPHITRPYKPGHVQLPPAVKPTLGSIPPPAAAAVAGLAPGGSGELLQQPGASRSPSCSPTRWPGRLASAGSSSSSSRSCSRDSRSDSRVGRAGSPGPAGMLLLLPATAIVPRPGSAAAQKILRSLRAAGDSRQQTRSEQGAAAEGSRTGAGQGSSKHAGAVASSGNLTEEAVGCMQQDQGGEQPGPLQLHPSQQQQQQQAHGEEAEAPSPSNEGQQQQQQQQQQQSPTCEYDAEQQSVEAAGAPIRVAAGTLRTKAVEQAPPQPAAAAAAAAAAQGSRPGTAASFYRPNTAVLRAMLGSAAGRDGVQDRLLHLQRLNEQHDEEEEGVDLVYGGSSPTTAAAAARGHQAAAGCVLPAGPHGVGHMQWLAYKHSNKPAAAAAADQAAPMVLNVEDFLQSSEEVVELELHRMGLQELEQLKAQLEGRYPKQLLHPATSDRLRCGNLEAVGL